MTDESYNLTDNISLSKEQKIFLSIFQPLLSERSEVEIDTKSNTLIFTDIKKRIDFQMDFVKTLDQSNLSFDEMFSMKSNGLNVYSSKIQLQNLDFSICKGQEKTSWREEQAWILLSIIKKIVSPKANIEIDSREKILTITDEESRVVLIEKIAKLFEKPFLEEKN